MEPDTMGRVLVEATLENLEDAWELQRGLRPLEQVRRITVADALVDAGHRRLIGNPAHGGEHVIELY